MTPTPARFANIRRYFVAGVVSLLPIGITLFVFYFLVTTLGPIFGSWLHFVPGLTTLPREVHTIIGFVLLMIVILIIGRIATGALGNWLLSSISDFFGRLPVIHGIYGTVRQLTDAVLVDHTSLKKVVMIEYPRKDIYIIAFLMSDDPVVINGRECHTVFVPIAPTPTSGWVHLLPASDITELSIGVDDALKLFISGGVVMPEALKKSIASKACPPVPEPTRSGPVTK